MKNTAYSNIILCKQLIEERLGWLPSQSWKQRDYLNLITLIENKTKISLSLSTIKRIWKPDYDGLPHPSTLEALARFLDYESWLDFEEHQKPMAASPNSLGGNNLYIWAVIIAIVVAVIAYFSINEGRFLQDQVVNSEASTINPIKFSCENVILKGVPNTVIFTYGLGTIEADSFFIQQSWNKFKRDHINKADTTLTSVYYFPGYHQAKLIADNKVVKETLVRINTDGWLALSRQSYDDNIPTYIQDEDIIHNGELKIDYRHLSKNNISLSNDIVTGYYYVNSFEKLNSGNFKFQSRLKCDSIVNVSCPHIGITILGEKGMHFLPLISKGCVGNAVVKFGDNTIMGKNFDLSALGVDVYDWQLVDIDIENNNTEVSINGIKVLTTSFNKDVGEIVGVNFNFTGSGAVDFITFSSTNNETIFKETFD